MTARDELLAAWEDWDAHPRDRATATRMVDAVAAAADELGIHAPHLHDRLMAGRREGLDREQILDQLWSGR